MHAGGPANPLFLMLIGVPMLLGTSAAPVAMTDSAASEERVGAEIMPSFKGMQDAANAHDAERHLAYYMRDPALTFLVNGTIIRGWDNLLIQQRKWWPGGKVAPTDEAHQPYRLTEGPDIQLLAPRLAMVTFVLDARRFGPDTVTRRSLAISQLWQKRSEGWKIIYVHESLGPERPDA